MPRFVSASRGNWSVPAPIDWIKRSRGARSSSRFCHNPDMTSTSASGESVFQRLGIADLEAVDAGVRARKNAHVAGRRHARSRSRAGFFGGSWRRLAAASHGVSAVIKHHCVLRFGEEQPALDDETEGSARHRNCRRDHRDTAAEKSMQSASGAPELRSRRSGRSRAAGCDACARSDSPSPAIGNCPACAAVRGGVRGRRCRGPSRSRPYSAPNSCR